MPEKKNCRSCDAPIFWLFNNLTGGLAPIDAVPDENGNIVILGDTHYAIVSGELWDPLYDGPRHKNHFATCPNQAKHRKKK